MKTSRVFELFCKPTIFLLIICLKFLFVAEVSAFCWDDRKNPGFSGPPVVEQVYMDTVNVSWAGLEINKECADQFLVKYWQRSRPSHYLTTEYIPTNISFVTIKVKPKVMYQFQAVAREDKGPMLSMYM